MSFDDRVFAPNTGFGIEKVSEGGVGLFQGRRDKPLLLTNHIRSAGGIDVTKVTLPDTHNLFSPCHLVLQAPCWQVCLPEDALYDIAEVDGNGCAVMVLPASEDPAEGSRIYYQHALKETRQQLPSWYQEARILDIAILPALQAVAVSYPSQRSETVMVGLHPLPMSRLLGPLTYELMGSLAAVIFNRRQRPTVVLDGGKLTVSGKTTDGDTVEFSIG